MDVLEIVYKYQRLQDIIHDENYEIAKIMDSINISHLDSQFEKTADSLSEDNGLNFSINDLVHIAQNLYSMSLTGEVSLHEGIHVVNLWLADGYTYEDMGKKSFIAPNIIATSISQVNLTLFTELIKKQLECGVGMNNDKSLNQVLQVTFYRKQLITKVMKKTGKKLYSVILPYSSEYAGYSFLIEPQNVILNCTIADKDKGYEVIPRNGMVVGTLMENVTYKLIKNNVTSDKDGKCIFEKPDICYLNGREIKKELDTIFEFSKKKSLITQISMDESIRQSDSVNRQLSEMDKNININKGVIR